MIVRTEEQRELDKQRLRDLADELTEELDVAGIPYQRILREYEGAVYVPAIEDNQVMIAMVGMRGAVPMQLCHRDPLGGQYATADSVDEAVRLVKAWYRREDGRKVPKRKRVR